jgi:hypothetical protein
MPIQLTTAFSVGSADVNSPYAQVKIMEFTLRPELKQVSLLVQYGNTADGKFTRAIGIAGVTVKAFTIAGSEYDTMVASTSAAANEVYYEKVAGLLYQWLIDKGHFVGTIV